MAHYFSGSNAQGDALQTLHLMNPGYLGYTDASNAGNMTLVNISAGIGQNNSVCIDNQQQHYAGFSLPPTQTHSTLSEQSTLPIMCNPNMGQQILSSSLFSNCAGNNPYWSTVNEFSFLPSNATTQIAQSLFARLPSHSINSGQQSNSDITQFDMGRQTLDGEQASMLHTGVALGSNTDNSPRHGLSLSLSPRQRPVQMHYYSMEDDESGLTSCPGLTHVAAEDSGQRVDSITNKCIGNFSLFRATSRDSLPQTGFQNSMNDVSNRDIHVDSNVSMLVGAGGLPPGSKFLKAAQQLLDEVVSVGHGLKSSPSKHVKAPPSWTKSSTLSDGSNRSTAEGITCTSSMPSAASGPEQNLSTVTELTSQERQDFRTKKAKLMAMLDEVDRRYKQYYSRMQIVITSFDSSAGIGAAKTYTSLALQTISKHFRCLRDAIDGQIRAASRALGEEDPGVGKGETSRLRYAEQHLRQQRALQHLGMMQQHAWRPQRGLPERSVSVLRAWLFEHFLHPYPKDADKVMLARQTGLSRNQVSNWFINARVRLWKPMVEEMYLEELKETDMDGAVSAEKASHRENVTSGVTDQGGAGSSENSSQGSKLQARAGAGNNNSEVDGENRRVMVSEQAEQAGSDMSSRQSGVRMKMAGGAADHVLDDEKHAMKKARNGIEGDDVYGARYADERRREEEVEVEALDDEKQQMLMMRGLQGSYELDASRYGFPAGWSNGVSLTLGLQHCDTLSVAGAHHNYLQSYGDGRLASHLAGAISESGSRHYDLHDAHHYCLNYETLSRKQIPAPSLHWPDFRRS